ncbi:hypothetical protein ACG1BZ_18425 [Microbulbifer sp. CNSA002]|uniref:hypothetical protein n=1 Tax=unclassified Microbulbifer TaxID=2619833 RepID=UPI0039B4CD68
MVWIKQDKNSSPNQPPNMKDINRMLPGIGGFLERNSDGEPDVKTVWQGQTKLPHYLKAAETLNRLKGYVLNVVVQTRSDSYQFLKRCSVRSNSVYKFFLPDTFLSLNVAICVRRAFLCARDTESGKEYEHRHELI